MAHCLGECSLFLREAPLGKLARWFPYNCGEEHAMVFSVCLVAKIQRHFCKWCVVGALSINTLCSDPVLTTRDGVKHTDVHREGVRKGCDASMDR